MCFNPEFATSLDFLSQRFNEYQANMMPKKGAEHVPEFYNNIGLLAESSVLFPQPASAFLRPDQVDNLLSVDGPFDTWGLTRKIKNGTKPALHYKAFRPGLLDGVVVYDVPISNLLVYDKNKKVVTQRQKNLPPEIGTINNSENYMAEKVMTKGFVVDLGRDGHGKDISLNHLSVYAFS